MEKNLALFRVYIEGIDVTDQIKPPHVNLTSGTLTMAMVKND
ncbi:hypothetical protein [Virgibacillus necropolis]|nr:hypothetical protein [Virgibacillus necropolis]